MTRVLTVLPAVPVPARAGLQLRMVEVLEIVQALGCHSTVLAFETEDEDAGIESMSALCDEPLCRGEAYAAVSTGDDCNFSVKLFHDFKPPVTIIVFSLLFILFLHVIM